MIVYCITNVLNGKRYIGCTSMNLKDRWNAHLWRLRTGCKTVLYAAMRKYGVENFHPEEMVALPQGASIQEMFDLEKHIIAREGTKTPHGYNLTDGGDGTIGYRYTEEQIERMKGRKVSLQTRQKMSLSQIGRKHNEEAKRKIGASAAVRNKGNKYCVGRKASIESRIKMSIAAKNRCRLSTDPAQTELEIN